MHLGDQLVQDGLISKQQLDTALKAQLQFGGRLGTNLIELGFVDPDTLARALSRKLSVPPALQKHFGSVEPHVVALFSAKFADRYKAVPLGLTVNVPHRLVVAFMDPIPGNLDEVAFAVSRRVEAGVAPELVILHCLEKFYGVKRGDRYLRVDLDKPQAARPAPAQAPAPAPVPVTRVSAPELKAPYLPHSSAALHAAGAAGQSAKAPPVADDGLAAPAWLAAPAQPAKAEALELLEQLSEPEPIPVLEPEPESAPAARVVPTAIHEVGIGLQEVEERYVPPPARRPTNDEIHRAAAAEFAIELQITPEQARNGAYRADGVARMPMESLADKQPAPADASADEYGEYDPNIPILEPYESLAPPPQVDAVHAALTASDAIAVIAKAETKDHIGDAVCDFLRSAFGCGLVLILKDDMALGWKGFASDVDASVVEAIALPMAGPSMLKVAVDGRAAFKGAPPPEGSTLQTRFWKLLRCAPPKEVIVAPIILGKRVVNLVYAHRFDGGVVPAEDMTALASVCEAATAGYMRLIRTGR